MRKQVSPGIYISTHALYNIQAVSGVKTQPVKPTNIKVDNSKFEKEGKVISWGEDNTHPQKILNEIKNTGVLGSAIKVRESAHFGNGLSLYKESETGDKTTIPYRSIPAFKEFDRVNYINLFFKQIIHDLEIHEVAFPEYVVSRDFSSISLCKRQPAPFCRFEEMNSGSGRIENIYINSDWAEPNHEYTSRVPSFSFMNTADEIKEYCRLKKIYKFIIPIYYTLDSEVYYPQPFWQAPIRNGWVRVVQSVPALKDAIQKNQLHFKYLISITEEYFIKNYEEWGNFTPEEKLEIYDKVIDNIDDHLSGTDAGGRSLTAPMYKDINGNPVKSIIIESIEDKLKDGAYLPDATAGNSEILFAKQVDPALIGQGVPGGKSLSGSGSDKREAYTILCATLQSDRVSSLLPFYFIRDWNSWGDDLDAYFPNIALTTLDKNPAGAETTTF